VTSELDEALASEQERAVRDQWRDGDWRRLAAVELADEDPDADPEPAAGRRVHERIVALTCGVDVQKDRFVYVVVGWAPNQEGWSIDAGGELHGDTANELREPVVPTRRTNLIRLAVESLLIGITVAAAIALIWAAQVWP